MGFGWQEIDKTLDLGYIRVAGLHRECKPGVLFEPPNFRPRTMTHVFIYVRMHMSTYICTYVYTYVHMYVHTYVHTYVRTCTHTYIYVYMYSIRICLFLNPLMCPSVCPNCYSCYDLAYLVIQVSKVHMYYPLLSPPLSSKVSAKIHCTQNLLDQLTRMVDFSKL